MVEKTQQRRFIGRFGQIYTSSPTHTEAIQKRYTNTVARIQKRYTNNTARIQERYTIDTERIQKTCVWGSEGIKKINQPFNMLTLYRQKCFKMGHKYHTTPLAIFFHIVLTINHYPKDFPPLLGFLPTANMVYISPFLLCIPKAQNSSMHKYLVGEKDCQRHKTCKGIRLERTNLHLLSALQLLIKRHNNGDVWEDQQWQNTPNNGEKKLLDLIRFHIRL